MLRKKRTRFNSSRGNDEKDEELSEISDISGPELPEAQPSKTKNKINKRTRSMFTYLEDKEMLNYIMTENRYNEIKGIALWKDMEILKITNHTKQSMKDRFVKKVIPNLHQYNVNPSWFKRLQRLFPEILKKNPDKENTKTESPLDANPNENKRHSSRFNFSPKNSKNTRKSKIEEESSNGDSEENRTHASVEGESSQATIPCISLLRSTGQTTQTNSKRHSACLNISHKSSKYTNISKTGHFKRNKIPTCVQRENCEATVPCISLLQSTGQKTQTNSKRHSACLNISHKSSKYTNISKTGHFKRNKIPTCVQRENCEAKVPCISLLQSTGQTTQTNSKRRSARLKISPESSKYTNISKTGHFKRNKIPTCVQRENCEATVPCISLLQSTGQKTQTNSKRRSARLKIFRESSKDKRKSKIEKHSSSDDSEKPNRTSTSGEGEDSFMLTSGDSENNVSKVSYECPPRKKTTNCKRRSARLNISHKSSKYTNISKTHPYLIRHSARLNISYKSSKYTNISKTGYFNKNKIPTCVQRENSQARVPCISLLRSTGQTTQTNSKMHSACLNISHESSKYTNISKTGHFKRNDLVGNKIPTCVQEENCKATIRRSSTFSSQNTQTYCKRRSVRLNSSLKNSKVTTRSRIKKSSSNDDPEEDNRIYTSVGGQDSDSTISHKYPIKRTQINCKRQSARLNSSSKTSKKGSNSKIRQGLSNDVSVEEKRKRTGVGGKNSQAMITYKCSPKSSGRNTQTKRRSARLNIFPNSSKKVSNSKIQEGLSSDFSKEEKRIQACVDGDNNKKPIPRRHSPIFLDRNMQTNCKRRSDHLNISHKSYKDKRNSNIEEHSSSDNSKEEIRMHSSVDDENSDATIPYECSPKFLDRKTQRNYKTRSSRLNSNDSRNLRMEESSSSDDSKVKNIMSTRGEGSEFFPSDDNDKSESTVSYKRSRKKKTDNKRHNALLKSSSKNSKNSKNSKMEESSLSDSPEEENGLHASVDSENEKNILYSSPPKSSGRKKQTSCKRRSTCLNYSCKNPKDSRNSKTDNSTDTSVDNENSNPTNFYRSPSKSLGRKKPTNCVRQSARLNSSPKKFKPTRNSNIKKGRSSDNSKEEIRMHSSVDENSDATIPYGCSPKFLDRKTRSALLNSKYFKNSETKDATSSDDSEVENRMSTHGESGDLDSTISYEYPNQKTQTNSQRVNSCLDISLKNLVDTNNSEINERQTSIDGDNSDATIPYRSSPNSSNQRVNTYLNISPKNLKDTNNSKIDNSEINERQTSIDGDNSDATIPYRFSPNSLIKKSQTNSQRVNAYLNISPKNLKDTNNSKIDYSEIYELQTSIDGDNSDATIPYRSSPNSLNQKTQTNSQRVNAYLNISPKIFEETNNSKIDYSEINELQTSIDGDNSDATIPYRSSPNSLNQKTQTNSQRVNAYLNISPKIFEETNNSKIDYSEINELQTSIDGDNSDATIPYRFSPNSLIKKSQTNSQRVNAYLNISPKIFEETNNSKIDYSEIYELQTSVDGDNSDATIPYRFSPNSLNQKTQTNSQRVNAYLNISPKIFEDTINSKIDNSEINEQTSIDGDNSDATIPYRFSPNSLIKKSQTNSQRVNAYLNISPKIFEDTNNSEIYELQTSVDGDNSDATIPYRFSPNSFNQKKETNCKRQIDQSNISPQDSKDARNSKTVEDSSSYNSEEEEEDIMYTSIEGLYKLFLKSSGQKTQEFNNNFSLFLSSSECEAEEDDINVVPNSAPTPKTSTASETIEDSPAHKDNSPSEQSDELSDYDQYLIGIAEKEKKPSRKLSTSSSTSSPPPHTTKERSFDLLNQTDQSMEVSSEKELNESNEESALPDRRARLQRRRQMRKSKQSSDDYEESSEKTSPLTSRHNNKRKRKITDYLTNSESEKNSLENEDEQPNSEEENTERPKPTSHHKKRRKTNAANCSVNSTSENISNENEDVQPNGVASPEEPTPSSSTSPVKEMRKRPLTISLTKEMSSEDKDADVQDKSEDQDETQKLNNYESIISNISKSTGLTKREVFYTIYCFNGNIDKAVTYIRLGPELSNLNPWSSEEDKIISSTDEASMKKVLKQRGNKHIAERLEFLELYSDSLT